MQHTLRRLFKWLGYLALGGYVALAIAVLGVRYWVLPNINHWREPLQHQISAMLPVQVELGRIEADWRGRNPRIRLHDAALRDPEGRLLLSIPALDAVLAWSSLFTGSPRFLSLHSRGVELSLRRDEHDRISLVGYEVEGGEPRAATGAANGGLLNWLSQQGSVSFSDARVVWQDDRRGAPALPLQDVSLQFGASKSQYMFSIQASPPAALGASFTLQGRVNAVPVAGQSLALADLSGLFYTHIDDMRPAGWAPWMDFHDVMEQGRVSWQGWQEVVNGEPHQHVSQLQVLDGIWHPAHGTVVAAGAADVYLAGTWQALHSLFAPPGNGGAPQQAVADATHPPVRVAVRMSGLKLEIPVEFQQVLVFDEIAASAALSLDAQGGLLLALEQAQLRNADMDLELQGSWSRHGAGSAGLVDMQGRFHRAELAGIVRYLPSSVNDDARSWLGYGLLAGRILDAPLRVQGDLARFPFGDDPEQGDFLVSGKVQGAVIDYAPAAAVGPPGWPRLEELNGEAQLHRVDLTIRADTMKMRPGGQTIVLHDARARIPNIDHDSILEVSGVGRAPAAAFVSLLRETPLNRMLDNVFDQARADGDWEVPLALSIPLMDVDASRVKGDIVFHKGGLLLDPDFPALSQLDGRLSFTDQAVSAKGLKAQALGGPVTISGGLGKGQKALLFDGSLDAQALSDYLGGRLGGLLEGSTAYRLALQRHQGGAFGMELQSPLEGLSLALPVPLAKAAAQRRPLKAAWTPGKGGAELNIHLSDTLTARFFHRDQRAGGEPFFHAGVLNLRGKAKAPAQGLALDIQAPEVDLDAWQELAGRLEKGGNGNGNSNGNAAEPAIFPPLRDLRLQADKANVLGVGLDQLTLTARRPDTDRWRVDISSTQTAGTLFWRERRGRIEGEVEAHFERLALGSAPGSEAASANEEAAFTLNDDIDFPAINLKVDRLRLYGRHLGALSLVGLNEAQGRRWKLEQLNVSSPDASFKGNGWWQLDGPQRGLSLQVHAMFDDLGAYLEQAGFKDLMQGGQGQVQGTLQWRDLPWSLKVAGLQGDLSVDLAQGRFASVGSRSARLLELLSLQSVKRLASLNWNPAGLMQQGFPFDTLQGEIKVNDGVLHSENYRVTGPVATIIIAGDVDLPQEVLDLYAMVVPNLDVSGAAIAAGIAVNPIVGVGAFLTQWLLKDPMSKAMAVEYRVKGDFDAPDVEAVTTSE